MHSFFNVAPRPGLPALAFGALLLSGCASFTPDGGMDSVSVMSSERIGQPVRQLKSAEQQKEAEAETDALLAQALTPDSAVRIALINNRGLQAAFAELGIAEADRVRAGRIANPGISFSRTRGGGDTEIERGVLFDLLGLLTIPLRSGIEAERFEQGKLQAAADAVKIAADTRRAYFDAVAAAQTLRYMEQVRTAAEAGAELAARMARVGNWSSLDQAREQVFHADAAAQYARAAHNATAAREQLTRLLGLWGTRTGFKLPDRLPDLPAAPREIADIERQAMQQRLDVQMAKRYSASTAEALGLSKATGFINVLHAGYVNRSETGSPRANGYEIELELPIFDWSGARTVKAEAIYMQSVHRAADIAVRARSEVRESYSAYRTTYELARHYRDEIVPLRKRISEEVLLRYNGMLASVFELLADARTQVSAVNSAIEAQRDFWLAETQLQAALSGSGGGNAARMNVSAQAAGGGH